MQDRELASLTTNGSTYTYDYDHEGIHTQKIGTEKLVNRLTSD